MTSEPQREHLFQVAYRMLGTVADAEEIVQEALLRWHSGQRDSVHTPDAFLTTMVTRLCLDRLKAARTTREEYVGPWLPEPLQTTTDDTAEAGVLKAESISFAFLALLERLSPLERAVYLLREVFDHSYAEISQTLERSEDACRKLAERAKAQVDAARPRFAPSKAAHRRIVEAFARAVEHGDDAAFRALLHQDVVSLGDGGGKATAARRPLVGVDEVSRLYMNLMRLAAKVTWSWDIVDVNGLPALRTHVNGQLLSVLQLETDGVHVFRILATLNPDKLSRCGPGGN